MLFVDVVYPHVRSSDQPAVSDLNVFEEENFNKARSQCKIQGIYLTKKSRLNKSLGYVGLIGGPHVALAAEVGVQLPDSPSHPRNQPDPV